MNFNNFLFSVIRNHIPDSRKPSTVAPGYDHSPPKGIRCPTCGVRSDIPSGGVTAFPPNYPLQHKMVLATINSRSTHLLCDICTADVSVSFINDIIKIHWTAVISQKAKFCQESLLMNFSTCASISIYPVDQFQYSMIYFRTLIINTMTLKMSFFFILLNSYILKEKRGRKEEIKKLETRKLKN